jgi:hypothetical protein
MGSLGASKKFCFVSCRIQETLFLISVLCGVDAELAFEGGGEVMHAHCRVLSDIIFTLTTFNDFFGLKETCAALPGSDIGCHDCKSKTGRPNFQSISSP